MRELTSAELQAVSGGAEMMLRRPEPQIVKLLVKVLAFFKRLECEPVRKMVA
jgi:hypothetical protein